MFGGDEDDGGKLGKGERINRNDILSSFQSALQGAMASEKG